MAKLIVDFDDKGETLILSDSEQQDTKKVVNSTFYGTCGKEKETIDTPVIEDMDDIDMKPDDTLEEDEEEQEGEEE